MGPKRVRTWEAFLSIKESIRRAYWAQYPATPCAPQPVLLSKEFSERPNIFHLNAKETRKKPRAFTGVLVGKALYI